MGTAAGGFQDAARANRLAQHAWIAGTAGAVTVVAGVYLVHRTRALTSGWDLFGAHLEGHHALFVVLAAVALVMALTELAVRWRVDDGFIDVCPDLPEGRYGRFLWRCLLEYAANAALITAAWIFYRHANEYGFAKNKDYYRPWFDLMDLLWKGYLWIGPFYILLTRALQHDPYLDEKDPSQLLRKAGLRLWYRVRRQAFPPSLEYTRRNKTALLGLFVKMFFVPLMTVFFAHQATGLARGFARLADQIPDLRDAGTYTHKHFNIDLHNIGSRLIYTVDVAVAFVGYVFTSRWLRNSTVSVEPTALGWGVALTCYAPFYAVLGVYFRAPAERAIMGFDHLWLVTLLVILSLLSFTIYMAATMSLGIRFSNLTHRGIVKRGPYAIVRHPAYASKNLAWWCIMMPIVLMRTYQDPSLASFWPAFGIVFMTYFYYWRAITEERHLSEDPEYLDYCKQVKYRFIPGLW